MTTTASSSTMKGKSKDRASIFQYSPSDHCFSFNRLPENASDDWRHDHDEWLQHTCKGDCVNDEERCHQPCFHSIEELNSFNKTGRELSQRLEQEFPTLDVEPFEPVYDQLRVSCTWWHLRDEKYGFPVSIQKLPVSDELKADFSLWRYKKDEKCLSDAEELEKEGNELQKRLYEELHQDDTNKAEDLDVAQSFCENDEEMKTDCCRRSSW